MQVNSLRYLNISMDELVRLVNRDELAILLLQEGYSTDTDILLENMLDYFVEQEFFEYACVVRDEINRRK